MLLPMNRRFLYTFVSALIILTGSLIAIRWAKGDFRMTDNGFGQTGLLSVNSFPTAAEVFINGKLATVTDDKLYLEPGEYTVEIFKDGYSPWRKQLQVQQELVTQTDALLFPSIPSLSPLTFTSAQNVSPSPDGQKLLYYTASASAQAKNGLYIFELTSNFLSLQKGARQIAEDAAEFDLANAKFIWSPDSSQVMVVSNDRQVLLDLDQKSDLRTLPDVSFRRRQILSEWQEEMYLRERQFLALFPDEVIAIATQSAKNVYFSPDKKRLLYTATASATLAENIVPPVPAPNNQPEDRSIDPGFIYVYDREEDKNFVVGEEQVFLNEFEQPVVTPGSPAPRSTPQPSEAAQPDRTAKQLLALDLFNNTPQTLAASPSAFTSLQATSSAQTARNFNTYYTPLYTSTFQWYPDSRHLLYAQDNQVRIKEYDGTNETALYSGPFILDFLYPWPDGSKILILTSFSLNTPHNLYAIEVK
jgi:hypothetical protein